MNLSIRSLVDKGKPDSERITLRATSTLDLGDYCLLQVKYFDGTLTTDVVRAYWFPHETIKKGDLVVLYTKRGTPREKALVGGNSAHFYYWNLIDAVWNDDEVGAVVLEAPSYEAKPVLEISAKRSAPKT